MPVETTAPTGSTAAALVVGSSFHDAWTENAAEPDLAALGQFLKCLRSTPHWVERCMAWRNAVVRKMGLKDLGGLGRIDPHKTATDYRPGDQVGIFTLLSQSPDEAVLGIDDSHLDVRLSVHRQAAAHDGTVRITVTTAVNVHNALGWLYMLPVKPMHRIIAPRVLATVGR